MQEHAVTAVENHLRTMVTRNREQSAENRTLGFVEAAEYYERQAVEYEWLQRFVGHDEQTVKEVV